MAGETNMNLNKVFILGNLTRDPEVRTTASGAAVVNIGVATNRFWKDQKGEKQKQAEFHNVVLFGRNAEVAKQYLSKGKSVLVEGRIQTRSWDAPDGSKKNKTEIIVEAMQLGPRGIGGGGSSGGDASSQPAPQQQAEVETIEYPKDEEINPDEIPF